jgi:hypothetical protein
MKVGTYPKGATMIGRAELEQALREATPQNVDVGKRVEMLERGAKWQWLEGEGVDPEGFTAFLRAEYRDLSVRQEEATTLGLLAMFTRGFEVGFRIGKLAAHGGRGCS